MSTVLASATNALMAALTGLPGAPAPTRIGLRATPASVSTEVVVRPLQAEAAQKDMGGAPICWQISMAVECKARVTSGTAPDVAVDALVQLVYAAIAADMTLGNQVIRAVPEHITYDFDADADQFVCATLHLSILQSAKQSAI